MTGNSSEIKKLTFRQAKRRKNITRYRKRARKHIFILTIPFIAYVMINIDDAFKQFGSVTKFVAVILTILIAFILIYLMILTYFIRQEQREIKIIKNKIYKLMKLSDD